MLGGLVKGLGGLAEKMVEGLTGSELLGDIAKIATNMATGNVLGVGEGAFDMADNVAKGAGKLASGIWNAAKDAVKEFSNPGRVKAPNKKKAKLSGYAQLKAENKKQQKQINNLMKQVAELSKKAGAGQTGGISGPGQIPGGGGSPISGPGQTPPSGGEKFPTTSTGSKNPLEGMGPNFELSGNSDIDNILKNDSLSFETKLLMILMKMASKKKEEVVKHMKQAHAHQTTASDAGDDTSKATKASQDQQNSQMLMQQAANDLSQLTQLATNMQKLFHDSKMATIQNIR